MELSDGMVIVIGIVASVMAQIFKVWRRARGTGPGQLMRDTLIFVASVGLVYVGGQTFTWPAFPAFANDPALFAGALVAWAGALFVVIGKVIGVAHAVYLVLKPAIYDRFTVFMS